MKRLIEAVVIDQTKAPAGTELTEGYGVFMSGGSIGEKRDDKPVRVHDTEEKAKDHAKRMNKLLSPGEKSYYKIKYHVKPVKEGVAVGESIDLDLDLDESEIKKTGHSGKEVDFHHGDGKMMSGKIVSGPHPKNKEFNGSHYLVAYGRNNVRVHADNVKFKS